MRNPDRVAIIARTKADAKAHATAGTPVTALTLSHVRGRTFDTLQITTAARHLPQPTRDRLANTLAPCFDHLPDRRRNDIMRKLYWFVTAKTPTTRAG